MPTPAKTQPSQAAARNKRYRLMEVGRKVLGWDEETFRAVLEQNGAQLVDGKPSRTTMALYQLDAVVARMKQAGFRPAPAHIRRRRQSSAGAWRQPRINKAYAIWCALADAGIVHSRSMASLHKYAYRITRKATLDWADLNDLNNVIEGLKDWAKRERVTLQ